MTYQEEEQAKLRRVLSKQAITLAMEGRWREAIVANESLIDNFPNDVNAYNRLGKAYMELGEYPQARGAYTRAVELDPYNTIAKKNLLRLSHLGEEAAGLGDDSHKAEPQHFIEEAGKAVGELPPEVSDKIPKPELEVEEESVGGPGYTIMSGGETEVLSEESSEAGGDQVNQVNNEK